MKLSEYLSCIQLDISSMNLVSLLVRKLVCSRLMIWGLFSQSIQTLLSKPCWAERSRTVNFSVFAAACICMPKQNPITAKSCSMQWTSWDLLRSITSASSLYWVMQALFHRYLWTESRWCQRVDQVSLTAASGAALNLSKPSKNQMS